MDVYGAIMKAADHIECRPEEFRWSSTSIPRGVGCGTAGCAVGWIGVFLGIEAGHVITRAAEKMGLKNEGEFYMRMREFGRWITAETCPAALRLYAAKYHAPAHRTDSELVADLMARVCGERIPEDVEA